MVKMKTVVKASAGTGKTYRLSLEYIYFLLLGIDFRNILVMTFTKKATAEIKNRIFEFILIIISKEGNYEELMKNIENNFGYKFKDGDIEKLTDIYKDMLINKNRVRIDTIDGFTSKVFNTCIAEPILEMYDYNILTEDTDTDKTLYTDFVVNLLNNKEFDFKFSSKDIKGIIKEIKGNFLYNKNELLSIKKLEEKYSLDYVITRVKNLFFNDLKIEYNGEEAKLKADSIKILEILEKINLNNMEIEYSNLKPLLNKMYKMQNVFNTRSKKSEVVKYLFEKNYELTKKIQDFQLIRYNYESTKKTNELLKNHKIVFDEDFRLKKANKLLDFNDITYYTFKYMFDEKLGLVKDGKVTDYFYELMDGKIDALMVDEFQDTSVLQFKFIKLIMDGAKIVTCVGDEKQSIYEWRGGYKKLFEDLDKALGEETVIKTLGTCYRSEKNIISFINNIFTKLPNYRYDEVKSSKEEKKSGYVETILVEKKSKDDDDIIKKIVEKIKENKDFTNTAILLRDNNKLEKIAKYLDDENIRYSLMTKSSILNVPSVKTAHKLVKYLVTKNEVNKYEFLRSDIKKYSLDEVSDVIQGKIDEDIKYFEDNFDRHNSFNSDDFDFAKEYIERFGYSLNDDSNDILNLNFYFEKMKEFSNIYDFYENIEGNKILKKSIVEKDGITLSTIHASKGLEYKNVYIYDDSFDDVKTGLKKYVAYDDEYNIIKFRMCNYNILNKMIKEINDDDKLNDFEKDNLMNNFKEFENAYDEYMTINKSESDAYLNLNYVAYTRAKENCYIFYGMPGPLIREEKILGTRNMSNAMIKEDNVLDYLKYANYFKQSKYVEVDSEKYDVERINRQKEGSAIHYFFEVYNGDVEIAIDIVKKKYGNLLSGLSFERVLYLIDKNVERYKNILESKNTRYSEFKIFDKDDNDKMYIIDLLLIDKDKKRAYIYDFKTGHNVINNPKYIKQLEKYKKILSKTITDYEIFVEILPLDE
ncbi:UvrD-helicase domain-containing protein [Streptobacillus moniliformis]|uniref:UvrD-helicase domain-containing protein n=1 Tax=Streptobacillus moniliformis TaxID=34105 RepID=UPI0007E2E7A0|nr:UvrD-helicase domain-containing protein [Streptobacillus moniliformis]